MADVLEVDLSSQTFKRLQLGDDLAGGRQLTSTWLKDNVPPSAHPLGPNNVLILANGPLAGTSFPCASRLSIGAKSPLTGGIKESNVGGTFGRAMAEIGYRAMVLKGTLPKKMIMVLGKDRVEFRDAENYSGYDNYQMAEILSAEYGKDMAALLCGPGGEMKLAAATVAVTDPEGRPTRHAGRGGMGAVMGAKGLKAVVIEGGRGRIGAGSDAAAFRAVTAEWAKALAAGKKVLTNLGTANLVRVVNELGGLPTRNFSVGKTEEAAKISGEALRDLLLERGGQPSHACQSGCVIRCSNVYPGPDGEYLTAGLEYETIGMIGSNCGIFDLDTIARMDRLCDAAGVDTMEVGAAIAVAMEGGYLQFGDGEGAIALLEEIRRGSPIGRILGNGAESAARAFGVRRVPTVKGQSMSAYDPRAFKGTGVTYATSPMGADHTAANCLPGRQGYRPENRRNFDPHDPEGQIGLSRDMQEMVAAVDGLGICFFAGADYPSLEIYSKALTAYTGLSLTAEDLIERGQRVLAVEKEFNRLAGFTEADDRLPEFIYEEELPPLGLTAGIRPEDLR